MNRLTDTLTNAICFVCRGPMLSSHPHRGATCTECESRVIDKRIHAGNHHPSTPASEDLYHGSRVGD